MQAISPPARKVGMTTKLAYGFGSIAYGIKDNGFQTLLLLYYNQVVGLPAGLVGGAIFLALVIDAFVDPVVGHYSDHLRSKWGRRHPFMYAAALPVGILYLLLWTPPTGNTTVTLMYLVVVAIAVRTAISCYEVPSSALAPELTSDYNERTSVLGYRYLFGWAGGMGMSLLTYLVFLRATPEYKFGLLNPGGYRPYAITAALAMTAAILISAWGTHREIRYLPRVTPVRTSLGETFRGIVDTLKNRAFLILFVSGIFSFTAQGLTFGLSTYVNTYFWLFASNVLLLFIFVVLGGVALAFAIASNASRLFGKRETAVAVGVLYPLVAISPYVLRFMGLFPANGTPALTVALMLIVLVATALGVAGSILGASMMADVVEDAQQKTGHRSEGLFFAGSFFMQKCVSGLGVFMVGAIISAVQFPTKAMPGTVPVATLNNLVLTYAGSLVGLSLIAAYITSRFPLGGKKEHDQRVARLAEVASHAAPLPGSEAEYGGEVKPAE